VSIEIRWLEETTSTNDVLRELARKGAPHGSAVATTRQTSGRGRLGRRWEMPAAGALALSVLIRAPIDRRTLPLVGFAAALPILVRPGLFLKWPNDVLDSDGRKVAGILTEAEWEGGHLSFAVVGIGVNVFAAPDLPTAASLYEPDESPGTIVSYEDWFGCRMIQTEAELAEDIRNGVLSGVERLRSDPRRLLDRWREEARLGMPVKIGEVEGIAEDVDDEGALLVRTASGSVTRVLSGDLEPIGGW
jgi:BirA family biotin operon repressor/biotin-[acetyl-CoA-carboxylase] ligase